MARIDSSWFWPLGFVATIMLGALVFGRIGGGIILGVGVAYAAWRGRS
jgi:hypothetical protein